ncbi:hypothetical protein BT67DRAFT_197014 [Trichocladium antarcticum]|uniref:Uncharacterized protein n=1 Tax=Trichocladium antarcticum TaxID=1450529 RepID=A0AAN6UQA0_9PEZI|nr:hypothetical protein BT67DRAFT_197014 [Trichocladium antarcticum]
MTLGLPLDRDLWMADVMEGLASTHLSGGVMLCHASTFHTCSLGTAAAAGYSRILKIEMEASWPGGLLRVVSGGQGCESWFGIWNTAQLRGDFVSGISGVYGARGNENGGLGRRYYCLAAVSQARVGRWLEVVVVVQWVDFLSFPSLPCHYVFWCLAWWASV